MTPTLALELLAAIPMAGMAWYVWRISHKVIQSLQSRIEYLEERQNTNQKRIAKLENYIHQRGLPVPNGQNGSHSS